MTSDTIHQVMEQYIANGEMAGGALIVRKNDEIVFDGKWGWADISARKPVTDDTIFRMASMTKVVTGVAIMKLIEAGKLGLDDPISRYLPQFADQRVCNDPRYEFKPGIQYLMTKVLKNIQALQASSEHLTPEMLAALGKMPSESIRMAICIQYGG